MPVLCPNCEEEELNEIEDGYVCPRAREGESDGCSHIFSFSEFKKMKSGEKPKNSSEDEDGDDDEEEEEESDHEHKQIKKKASVRTPTKNTVSLPLSSTKNRVGSFGSSLKARLKKIAEEKTKDIFEDRIFSREEEEEEDLSQKDANVKSLLKGDLVVERAPLLPVLSVKGAEDPCEVAYRRPYIPPRLAGKPSAAAIDLMSNRIRIGKRLGARPGPSIFPTFKPPIFDYKSPPPEEVKFELKEIEKPQKKDETVEPLILWEPTPQELEANPNLRKIEVEYFICKFLRPHQRQGVRFLAECVLGQRQFKGSGAILADDMGLGKTLQSITLLYTLLSQGFEKGVPVARKAIIICPTSLVDNWKNEISKWVGDRITPIALSDSVRDKVIAGIDEFTSPQMAKRVLIISYETFRIHSERFANPSDCELLICDEAHRLKNSKTTTYETIHKLPCRVRLLKRVLLSGTPMQNDLSEFFSMVNFTNPEVIGDRLSFRSYYENPILRGREPDATDEDTKLGIDRSSELSAIVNQFILRRTNVLLSAHLPPKVIQVVCCRPTEFQKKIYTHLIESKSVKKMLNTLEEGQKGGGGGQVLPLINNLKKLCNHPKLLYDALQTKEDTSAINFLTGCEKFFDAKFMQNPADPSWSGKMSVLDRLLQYVKTHSDDRVVIVSNYTQTLDVIGQICQMRHWEFLRLDGSTSVKKRQELVNQLSDRKNKIFVFLLSSKAGGCGLNLVGANRLILFDPDWNPAVDKQAAARVWRDGQSKRCFIYRFLTSGAIEEKVYQRQLSKEGLQNVIGGGSAETTLSSEELRDLFTIRQDTLSDTHDTLSCNCCEDDDAEDGIMKRKKMKGKKAKTRKNAKKASKHSDDDENDDDDGFVVPDGEEVDDDCHESKMDEETGVSVHNSSVDVHNDEDIPPIPPSSLSSLNSHHSPQKTSGLATTKTRLDSNKVRAKLEKYPDKPLIGQRGEPPEEELINWAHHISVDSVPDPMFRKSFQGVPSSQRHVTFVFSCEVKGRPISDKETAEAAKVSCVCDLPPVVIEKEQLPEISAEEALARQQVHEQARNAKKMKRLGVDEGGNIPSRRTSTRARKQVDYHAIDDPFSNVIPQDLNISTVGKNKRKSEISTAEHYNLLMMQYVDSPPKKQRTRKSKNQPLQDITNVQSTDSVDVVEATQPDANAEDATMQMSDSDCVLVDR